ncbi:MAG: uroporphyrinogen decarboxylase [Elusimicrobia bacterium]|nr:uroporphyrinogen decarboxylase [Elusimicrobiota bacterium]
MEQRSSFLSACRGQAANRIPVWFMRQAGRYMPEYQAMRRKYSILELAKTPELACEVTLQPVRRMPVDAAIIFADILLPLEPLGARLRFAPGPILGNPLKEASQVARLPEFDVEEKLGFVFKAIALAVKELKGLPLIGFAAAPFTLASYLIEGGSSSHFLKTKAFMHSEPRAWDLLMRKLRAVTARYLEGQAVAGASALQLFDSWVGALSPDQYRSRVLPHSAWVLERLKKTKVPLIHFGTGTAGFLEDFAGAGGDVVGVDWRIDLSQAFKRAGKKAVQGNLDPALLMVPKKALRQAVDDILRQADGRPGYIFNLGHGILPQTPFENVSAVVDWVHGYRR